MSESETVKFTKDQVASKAKHLGSDQSETVKRDFYAALAVYLGDTQGTDRTAKIAGVRESALAKIAVNKGQHDGVKLASVSTWSKFAAYSVRFESGLNPGLSLEIPARAASAGGAADDAAAVKMANDFAAKCETNGVAPSIRTAREEWPTESAGDTGAQGKDAPLDMGDIYEWMLSQTAHVVTWAESHPVEAQTIAVMMGFTYVNDVEAGLADVKSAA